MIRSISEELLHLLSVVCIISTKLTEMPVSVMKLDLVDAAKTVNCCAYNDIRADLVTSARSIHPNFDNFTDDDKL